MLWKALVKQALLGTENTSFPESTVCELAELGINTEREAPQLLADGTAMLTQMRKAGFLLDDFEGELPLPPIATQSQQVSPKTAHLLKLIIAGQHAPVLPEFFFLLKKTGKTLPTSEIPSLMQLPQLPVEWPVFLQVLDERGLWLLRQHPEWSAKLADPSSFDWQTGSRTQRLAMFAFWRKQSPNFALELLQNTWEAELPADKHAFLSELGTGLSMSDEPFLEACLDDRRKEVRQAAAKLLALLPDSRLSLRFLERAAKIFTLKNNTLLLSIPEEPDAAAQRDGIVKIRTDLAGGVMAAQLFQVVSQVPTDFWGNYFQKTPTEVFALFSKTDWPDTLQAGLMQAIVFHKNTEWATMLAEQMAQLATLDSNHFGAAEPMLALVPAANAHRIALQCLQGEGELPGLSSLAFRLFQSQSAPWPDTLTMLVINKFRRDIFRDYRQVWQLQHLQEWLNLLAIHCHPALYDQLQTGWSSDAVQWRYWERPVENMLARVLFRRELSMEFQA